MKIACLCPTYGKPRLLQNALAQFQAQSYPAELRRLFILEDAGQFFRPGQLGEDFSLWHSDRKFPTLTAKYAYLVARALDWGADAFVVWDDDDIYLPDHLADHARVLERHGWSHPATVWSLYTGRPVQENAAGRFHAALAFRRDYGDWVGYWGDVSNGRCDYDQAILGRLRALSPPGQSDRPPTFCMRWGSTQCDHCSGRASKDPNDLRWYTETPISQLGPADGVLRPEMDAETRRIYEQLGKKD